ncbi:hypothetical protein NFJ02_02g72340 [Pycnococcus provasolii]
MATALSGLVGPASFPYKRPQPYQLVHELLTDVVEAAVSVAGAAETVRLEEDRRRRATTHASRLDKRLEAPAEATCFAVAPDGSHTFAGTASGELMACDTETGEKVASISVHASAVHAIAVTTARIAPEDMRDPQASVDGTQSPTQTLSPPMPIVVTRNAAAAAAGDLEQAGSWSLAFSSAARDVVLATAAGHVAVYRLPKNASDAPDKPQAPPEKGAKGKKAAEAAAESLPALRCVAMASAASAARGGADGAAAGAPTVHAISRPLSEDRTFGGDTFAFYAYWPGARSIAYFSVDASYARLPPDGETTVDETPMLTFAFPAPVVCSAVRPDGAALLFGLTDGSVYLVNECTGVRKLMLRLESTVPVAAAFLSGSEKLDDTVVLADNSGGVYLAKSNERGFKKFDQPLGAAATSMHGVPGFPYAIIATAKRVAAYCADELDTIMDFAPAEGTSILAMPASFSSESGHLVMATVPIAAEAPETTESAPAEAAESQAAAEGGAEAAAEGADDKAPEAAEETVDAEATAAAPSPSEVSLHIFRVPWHRPSAVRVPALSGLSRGQSGPGSALNTPRSVRMGISGTPRSARKSVIGSAARRSIAGSLHTPSRSPERQSMSGRASMTGMSIGRGSVVDGTDTPRSGVSMASMGTSVGTRTRSLITYLSDPCAPNVTELGLPEPPKKDVFEQVRHALFQGRNNRARRLAKLKAESLPSESA